MLKKQKEEYITKLAERLKNSKSVVLVDYAKTDFKTQSALQKKLNKVNAKMIVVKNTLLKIAGEKAGLSKEILDESLLVGQSAVILSDDDPVAPIQTLGEFLKLSETPKPKAGLVEGLFQDKDGILKISKLPGKTELFGQVIGSIQSPLYGLVSTLQGNLQKLIFILSAKVQA